MGADIVVINHGSVCILKGESEAGKAWLDEHVQAEGWQNFGGGIAAEPRYVNAVLDGAIADGLIVD